MLNLGHDRTFNTSVSILTILANIHMDGPAGLRAKRYSYQQLTRLINQIMIISTLGLLDLLDQTQSGRPTN